MPSRTYMQIDARRDHSFSVPQPQLSDELGLPNVCAECHGDRDASWASEQVAAWRGGAASPERELRARALAAGRALRPGAKALLERLATAGTEPAIARATAVSLHARQPATPGEKPGARAALLADAASDPDPLLRAAAAMAAHRLAPADRVRVLGPLLEDPLRSVRIEAARALAGVPRSLLRAGGWGRARERALAELRRAELHNADEPSAHVNLALIELAEGRPEAAEAAYRRALEVGPYFLPATVNLADLLRAQGRDEEGERLLRRASESLPESASVEHALGLLLVRRGATAEAVERLGLAARLAPGSPRYAYVYGVALSSTGRMGEALEFLESALGRHPGDRGLLEALVALHRDAGNEDRSREFARRLGGGAPPQP